MSLEGVRAWKGYESGRGMSLEWDEAGSWEGQDA